MITEMMLVFAVFTCSLSSVYTVPEARSYPTIEETLAQVINDTPYEIDTYELWGFDCTRMASIMQRYLTENGYCAKIVTFRGRGITGHAMVRVYSDKTYLIECTAKKIVAHPPAGYTETGEYEDIVDAVENSGWGASDWGLELYLEERIKKEKGKW